MLRIEHPGPMPMGCGRCTSPPPMGCRSVQNSTDPGQRVQFCIGCLSRHKIEPPDDRLTFEPVADGLTPFLAPVSTAQKCAMPGYLLTSQGVPLQK